MEGHKGHVDKSNSFLVVAVYIRNNLIKYMYISTFMMATLSEYAGNVNIPQFN